MKLPRLSNLDEESAVIAGLAGVGQEPREGEFLMVVETAKAQVEVPAPVSGVLAERLVDVDEEIPIDTAIAVMEVDL